MISIRWRLTILLCLAMGVLFVLAGFGVFLGMERRLNSLFDETLTAKSRALITASEVDEGDFEVDLTVQDFAGFGKGGDDYFEIRRTKGGLVLRSPSLREDGRAIDRFDRFEPPGERESIILKDRLADGRPARFYLQKIFPKDDEEDRYQDLYLITASSTRAIQRDLNLLATVLCIAGGAAILFMVPVIRFGMGRGLRPLDRLSENISRIRSEDLHERIETGKLPAELKPVADSLNEWLGRLEESFERERRFSSHAAHELRTPLAEIRSIAELGARWPEEATPEHCAEIVTVTGELEILLDKLSLLARADARRQPVRTEVLELAGLVSTVTSRYEEKARQRGIELRVKIDGEMIETDAVLWNAIFQNLVGNAVSHSPGGSMVNVHVTPGFISVSNPAPDLTGEDIPHLFERFWRKDEAHGGYEHSGLGMSIVKACSGLLDATCSARLSECGELVVEVRFQ